MTYYLDPEFDPKKLTKAELRSIMASHGILDLPPATSKKEELLDLFYKEIIAKKKLIIETRKNIKAKSDGIVFLDEASRPSPKKPKTPLKNKLESILVESKSRITENDVIERPITPIAVSTYKLVSRLENLQEHKFIRIRNLSFSKIFTTLLIIVSLLLLIYLKFFYDWPVYTDEQWRNLPQKPIFYLKCPIPPNSIAGSCSDGKLYCSNGYIEKRNWLKFGNSCVIDKERMSTIQRMKKRMINELQTRLGASHCHDNISPFIERNELQTIVSKYFRNIKSKTFLDYFEICIRLLLQDDTNIEATSSETFFQAKNPIYTCYCKIKISLRKTLNERPVEVISGVFFVFFVTALLFQFRAKQKKKNMINHYYLLVCKILKEQSSQHRKNSSFPSYISINQLRDAVLIKLNAKEKSQIWPKIMTEVTRNSNIVESITIIRGEQTRVWEWIGTEVSL